MKKLLESSSNITILDNNQDYISMKLEGVDNLKEYISDFKENFYFIYNDRYKIKDVNEEGFILEGGKLLEWYYIKFEDYKNTHITLTMEMKSRNQEKNIFLDFYPNIDISKNFYNTKAGVEDRFSDYEERLFEIRCVVRNIIKEILK